MFERVISPGQFLVCSLEVSEVPLLQRNIHVTMLQITIDVVAFHAISDDLVTPPAHIPDHVGVRGILLFEPRGTAEPTDHLAAITA